MCLFVLFYLYFSVSQLVKGLSWDEGIPSSEEAWRMNWFDPGFRQLFFTLLNKQSIKQIKPFKLLLLLLLLLLIPMLSIEGGSETIQLDQ